MIARRKEKLGQMTSINMKLTGLRLKLYATRQGLSVKDIQIYLCLSCPQPIYRWYKGIILPSIDNLLRLSELFNVHMEDLLVKNNDFDSVFDKNDMNFQVNVVKRLLLYCDMLALHKGFGLSVQ